MVKATPNIDLDIDLVRNLCRGNPANLPSFMVHDDDAWPWGVVRIDRKRRIHLRRTDFLEVVAPAIPVKPGLFLRVDCQVFTIDLAPHHLDGDTMSDHVAPFAGARKLVQADAAARIPGEEGYGEDEAPLAASDGGAHDFSASAVAARRARQESGRVPQTLGLDDAKAPRPVRK